MSRVSSEAKRDRQAAPSIARESKWHPEKAATATGSSHRVQERRLHSVMHSRNGLPDLVEEAENAGCGGENTTDQPAGAEPAPGIDRILDQLLHPHG